MCLLSMSVTRIPAPHDNLFVRMMTIFEQADAVIQPSQHISALDHIRRLWWGALTVVDVIQELAGFGDRHPGASWMISPVAV